MCFDETHATAKPDVGAGDCAWRWCARVFPKTGSRAQRRRVRRNSCAVPRGPVITHNGRGGGSIVFGGRSFFFSRPLRSSPRAVAPRGGQMRRAPVYTYVYTAARPM